MARRRRFFAVSLLVAIDGCHGAGSSSLVPQRGATQAALTLLTPESSVPAGTASFSVRVPAGETPQMRSLTIVLAQHNGIPPATAVTPVTLDLARNAAGCAPQNDGSIRCTAAVAAPAGTDTFTIVTYAQRNGVGAAISTTQATAVITAGGRASCTQTSSGLEPAKTVAP